MLKNRNFWLILSFVVFLLISFLIIFQNPHLINLDSATSKTVMSMNSKTLIAIFVPITETGSVLVSTLILIFFILILINKNKLKEALVVFLSPIVAIGLTYLLKFLVERPRPLGLIFETNSSFPSQHATISAIIIASTFLIAVFIKNKTWRNLILSLVTLLFLAVSASRIMLNVHWFSDVWAGFSLGLSIFLFFYAIICQKKEKML